MTDQVNLVFRLLLLYSLLTKGLTEKPCELKRNVAPCPVGWTATRNPRTCIRYVDLSFPWSVARQYCRVLYRADLVVARDEIMAYFLMGFMKVNLPLRPYTYWLAMRYENGEWTWSGGDKVTSGEWEQPRYDVQTRFRKCAFLDTRGFVFREAPCGGKTTAFLCMGNASTSGGCPEHYSFLGRGQGCLRESWDWSSNQWYTLHWYNAGIKCTEWNGTKLAIKNRYQYYVLKEYLENRDKIWLGLVKSQIENGYVWMNGKRTSYTTWAKVKGQRAACTSMDAHGLWHDEDCEESARFVCQKPSDVGPMDLDMQFRFHLPTNSFFLGQQLEATCSVLGAEDDHITWETADNMTDEIIYIHADVSLHIAPTLTASGKCLKKSVSKLTMTVTDALQGLKLMCFAYEPPAQHICTGSLNDPPSFCAVSEVINVVDGPKGPPEFTHNFELPPAQIRQDQTLRLTCRVYPGRDEGTLIWVFYTKSGVYREILMEDGLIESYKHVNTTRGPSIVSVLEFLVLDASHNTSIACFAYDVFTHISYIDCEPDDRYCHRTDPIQVLPPGAFDDDHVDHSWSQTGFFVICFYLVLILLCVIAPMRRFGTYDEGHGEHLTDFVWQYWQTFNDRLGPMPNPEY